MQIIILIRLTNLIFYISLIKANCKIVDVLVDKK